MGVAGANVTGADPVAATDTAEVAVTVTVVRVSTTAGAE